jgi:hypothetical protein
MNASKASAVWRMAPQLALAAFVMLNLPPVVCAQSATAPGSAAKSSTSNSAKPKSPARVPDLSGLWGPTSVRHEGEARLTWDPSDPAGQHPERAPMTPWSLEKFKQVHPPFGANETFEAINDPVQLYCDPSGVSRIYFYPWQFTFLQTADEVYILYEFSRTWRSVAMNRDHPKDPDATWLGDSVGHYEGDTLVVDTVGFNDKTWLDHVGHPHSDELHLIERFRRLNHDTLQLTMTVEDPKAYTHSFTNKKTFSLSDSPMGETICSSSEMQSFQKEIIDPTTTKPASK